MTATQMPLATIADILRVHAAGAPRRIALQFEGRRTTYAEWDRLCNRLANATIASGLGAGSRIGYLGKNSDRLLHLLFGGAKAGTVLVPLNWRLASEEMAFILDDARCELLFVGRDYVALIEELRAKCPRIRQVVAIDEEGPGCVSWGQWLSTGDETDPRRELPAAETVLQLYTSGTTGRPKGAELTHRNLLFAASLGATETLGRWQADEVSVLPLPLFHAGGIIYGLNGPYAGCTTVVVREPNPVLILDSFREAPAPVTRLGVVPAVLQMMLDHPACATTDFSSLRTMTYGGSPIAPAVLRRAIERMGQVLVQLFGMTETATIGTALLPADHDPANPERLTSCGRPLPGVELRIVGADGAPATVGESGEILLRSAAVMKCYWNRPEATRAALQEGWYHTGDAGYLDEQGYLYIQDRLKDMVISGGENIYPAEVERVVAEHPAVADVAVIGVPDAKWGETVKAIVVVRNGQSVTPGALVEFARERLAGYKCPKSVDFIDALPRNASGKILKRVLREPYWQGQSRNVS